MLRTFATAALLALSIASAQAGETLAERIHTAAVAACAPEMAANMPAFHYGAIAARCVDRISASAIVKYQTDAAAKMKASTAVND